MKVKKLTLKDPEYPAVLRLIPNPPKQLFVLGDLDALLQKPRLSVVGSRKVSPYGQQVTAKIVREVSGYGVVIISGLALGVDAIAHKAALEVDSKTIAVLGHGLDQIYPVRHHYLAKEILARGGALVSEYPEGTPPLPHHFIARNRIVSGLGGCLMITEAAEKSGTLHTANFALEQGKTVMAIPGNITSPLSGGTNNLLKTGATLVTDASDVLLALGLEVTNSQQEIFGSNPEEMVVIKLLQSGITDGGELLAKSNLAASSFNQTLTMLEISGKIRSLGADNWSLK